MGPDCSVGKPRDRLLTHSILVFHCLLAGGKNLVFTLGIRGTWVGPVVPFLTLTSLAVESAALEDETKTQMIVLVPVPLWFHHHKWMTGPGGLILLAL